MPHQTGPCLALQVAYWYDSMDRCFLPPVWCPLTMTGTATGGTMFKACLQHPNRKCSNDSCSYIARHQGIVQERPDTSGSGLLTHQASTVHATADNTEGNGTMCRAR